MDASITHQLKEMFHETSQLYVLKFLTTESELLEFDEINRTATEKYEKLKRDFDEQYVARVETARQSLYDKTAQPGLNHPSPAGATTNTDESITRRAHQMVQLAHEANQQGVLKEAQEAVVGLLDRAFQDRGGAPDGSANALLRTLEQRLSQNGLTPKQSQD